MDASIRPHLIVNTESVHCVLWLKHLSVAKVSTGYDVACEALLRCLHLLLRRVEKVRPPALHLAL